MDSHGRRRAPQARVPGAGSAADAAVPRRTHRHSPAVYRRRRLVLGLMAVVAAGALVWAGTSIAALLPSGPSGTGEQAGPTPAPEGPTTPVCNPARVAVSAAVDAQVYAAGQKPVLTLMVTNKGEAPCPVNVGTAEMEFVITSGSDRIFSSKDCQKGARDLRKMLAPGASEMANFTWNRNRSVPGCTDPRAEPRPGTYVLVTHLGERTSKKAVFTLE